MKKTNLNILAILALILILVNSCENVEEGYRVNYNETPAQFSVTLLSPNRGAISDSISFSIKASSEYDIKSLVVTSTVSGGSGTGYYSESDMSDPFVDHAYGTVQPGIREIEVIYYYVVSQDTVDANITFTLVDGYGMKTIEQELITVPSIVRYDDVVLYSQTSKYTDGFSTIDGMVYPDLSDYEDVTVVNETIQESLDIIFLSDELSSALVAPYSGYFSSGMAVRNKTLFKSISGLTNEEFDNLTSASLSEIADINEVKKGATDIQNIKVGDIIGFRTDFNSANPYHYGILKINAIHPTIVDHYTGTSYLIEMDIVTQK